MKPETSNMKNANNSASHTYTTDHKREDAITNYEELARIDFLPELPTLDLHGKAQVIQSLLEKSFFHPSGLFYSILLIDRPHHVRPMTRTDMEEISDTVVDGCYNDEGASSEPTDWCRE